MAAKTPENTYVEFKQQGQLRVALILENRGLCWKVRDEKTDEEFQVQKRSVTRQWVERVRRDPYACRNQVPSYQEWSKKPVETSDMYTELRRRMQEGQAEFMHDPELGPRLREQLTQTTYYPGTGGIIKIVLPKIGWSHGDLLETTAIAVTMVELRPVEHTRRSTVQRETMGDWSTDNRGTTPESVVPRGFRDRLGGGGGGGDERGFG